jgi:hypothetical protein
VVLWIPRYLSEFGTWVRFWGGLKAEEQQLDSQAGACDGGEEKDKRVKK